MAAAERLIFVYNAEAGLLHGMIDSIHKIVSPETYGCSLCALTHGSFTMRPAWRSFLKGLNLPVDFFHRTDFVSSFSAGSMPLPAIFLARSDQLCVVMDAAALGRLKNLQALIDQLPPAIAAARANSLACGMGEPVK